MVEDSNWPRASSLITKSESSVGLLDVPAHKTSISKTNAHQTPLAIRQTLIRFSTFSYTTKSELGISIQDLGAIENPDENELETQQRIQLANKELLIALGGDNSITYAVAKGVLGEKLEGGLITLDAHHDLRDGKSNGSPIRRLIEAGLNPKHVVQIGINDFSNSPEYARRAAELGITVISRTEVAEIGISRACEIALEKAGSAAGPIHVDLDVDVCDRSVVPACPAAAPGGLSAFELRKVAFLLARNPQVRGLDITEIDATADSTDQRTVRLGALLLLEALAGYSDR